MNMNNNGYANMCAVLNPAFNYKQFFIFILNSCFERVAHFNIMLIIAQYKMGVMITSSKGNGWATVWFVVQFHCSWPLGSNNQISRHLLIGWIQMSKNNNNVHFTIEHENHLNNIYASKLRSENKNLILEHKSAQIDSELQFHPLVC